MFAKAVPRVHDAIEALDDAGRELRLHFHAGPVDLPVFLAFGLAEQALHAGTCHGLRARRGGRRRSGRAAR